MNTRLKQRLAGYKNDPFSLFLFLITHIAIIITLATLAFIVIHICVNGIPSLSPELFEAKYNSTNVSMMPSIINTLCLIGLSLLIAVPLGIGSAIYLVEYASRQNRIVKYILITTETLSGIPSIVYGLFGWLFFSTALHMGFSLSSGALTIAIMILPLIIRSTQEALKSVPDTYREASFGIGAGNLRTVFRIVLPSAIPGILAGIILAIGRIIGETAALLYTFGTATKTISNLQSSGRTLSVHMYILSTEGFHVNQAYATAVVLLLTVFLLNTIASIIAKKLQRI